MLGFLVEGGVRDIESGQARDLAKMGAFEGREIHVREIITFGDEDIALP
jgi:hypothetical protein